jgi:hypothetical protein
MSIDKMEGITYLKEDGKTAHGLIHEDDDHDDGDDDVAG